MHVELALIRLTYLLQAIELSASPEGVNKKKLVDVAKPVAFRNIPIIKTVLKPALKKETAKLEIEEFVIAPEPVDEKVIEEVPAAQPVNVKSAQLDKLRKQIAERANHRSTRK